MATGTIRLSPKQLEDKAKRFRQEKEQLERSRSTMKNLIGQLEREWEGEASKSYKKRFETIEPVFRNACELMDELDKNLTSIANTMRETDLTISNKLNAGR